MSYKSRKVSFFKNKKILEIGEYVTPNIVKFFSKLLKNEMVVGRGVEYIIIAFFVLSIFILLS